MTEVVGPFWKSSYSGQENNCIEVAATTTGGRAVRDSKQHDGPLLAVSLEGWHAFVAGAQGGAFGDVTRGEDRPLMARTISARACAPYTTGSPSFANARG